MPFTLSHAAAALPFRRFRPIWPALVIGTFAPDFEYFFRMSDEDRAGHHFPDVLIFTLPLALLVLWLFESYAKDPVIELLPLGLQRRLQRAVGPMSFAGLRRSGAILGWTALGIATHLVWDSVTHPDTWFWQRSGWLRERVPVPWHAPVAVSKLLQASSTVLGLAILLVWFILWYRNEIPVAKFEIKMLSSQRKVLTVLTLATLALFGGYYLAEWRLSQSEASGSPLPWIITIMEAVTLLLFILVLLYGAVRMHTISSAKDLARDNEHA